MDNALENTAHTGCGVSVTPLEPCDMLAGLGKTFWLISWSAKWSQNALSELLCNSIERGQKPLRGAIPKAGGSGGHPFASSWEAELGNAHHNEFCKKMGFFRLRS